MGGDIIMRPGQPRSQGGNGEGIERGHGHPRGLGVAVAPVIYLRHLHLGISCYANRTVYIIRL